MSMLGNNIKVHFAGNDGEEIFFEALNAAHVNYRLYSCYKFLRRKKPDDDFVLPKDHVIRVQCMTKKHVIQDSGLFTLMFGAGKGQKQTVESLTAWQDMLVKFVQQNQIYPSVVEIDCQKVLGVEEAWHFRERMKTLLPDRKIINVWHFEDGKNGLDRMIEFADYIALSVPEWRIVKKGSHRSGIRHTTDYIKNRKPEIDIHLLGCTDLTILKENTFCTSADSTSWLQGPKYGYQNLVGKKRYWIRNIKKSVFDERQMEIKRLLDARGVQLKERTLQYATNSSICATICKGEYAKIAGRQD